jgi:hypothetical protein
VIIRIHFTILNSEEMLKAGQSLVKNAGDQVAKQTSMTTNTAVNQLTGPGTNEVREGGFQNLRDADPPAGGRMTVVK